MTRLELILTSFPHELQIFVRFKVTDGSFDAIVGLIDTGAEVCLFPRKWLETAEHRIIEKDFYIEQAGIASQAFDAVEAEITIYCEDKVGNESAPMNVRAWFADTTKVILGFRDVLDHAKLYIDYQETRTGWLEL